MRVQTAQVDLFTEAEKDYRVYPAEIVCRARRSRNPVPDVMCLQGSL